MYSFESVYEDCLARSHGFGLDVSKELHAVVKGACI